MNTVGSTPRQSRRGHRCRGVVIDVNLEECTLHIRQVAPRRSNEINGAVENRAVNWHYSPHQVYENRLKRNRAKARFKRSNSREGDEVSFEVFDQDQRLACKVRKIKSRTASPSNTATQKQEARVYQGVILEANRTDIVLEIGFFGKNHSPGGPFVYTIGHYRPLDGIKDPEKQEDIKVVFLQSAWAVGQDVICEISNHKRDLVHKVRKTNILQRRSKEGRSGKGREKSTKYEEFD